ncbi:DNA alkylation repair protein [Corynebacterium canis]|uniref:DNA alkylation repair protein n=1 Tax=Corynebacterium canis TaxID=679663 RepID=A0A5C5UKD6_9CORY|nr:DNA alkylation repair protein [Corynebacterium canis]TWT26694.1 DNA alkylation repair protein [Corynebacterium canis]WJY74627.1 DNA alkylation repair enzyme [Corynebacterium canis]
MGVHYELVSELRASLPVHADPERAAQQQRYLKTHEPLLGLQIPQLRTLVRQAARNHAADGLALPMLIDTARELWDHATHREFRRAAIMLLLIPKHAARLDASAMGLVEHFVRTGAWWDLVDECVHVHNYIRGRRGDAGFAAEFERMTEWARDPDRWIRRFAILCQLQAKADTDIELLSQVVEANITDPEFFVAKAIGWALRDYARTDPEWVREFVAAHPDMQPLSRREALKHL